MRQNYIPTEKKYRNYRYVATWMLGYLGWMVGWWGSPALPSTKVSLGSWH